MSGKRVLLIGHGCREVAIAQSVVKDGELFAFMKARNPSIESRSSDCRIGEYTDFAPITRFAAEVHADLVMVGPEDPIAAGLADALTDAGFWVCAPTREAFQLEGSKVYMREFLERHVPGCNVPFRVVRERSEVESFFGNPPWPAAVKPTGLTGGKGVRVQGVNLSTADEAVDFTLNVIATRGGAALLEQRIDNAVEFTLHCVTDGVRVGFFRATYDYSYRDAGDTGPQTGGMGCYSAPTPELPFMSAREYESCCAILRNVLGGMRADGIAYRGVLQGQFFLTASGPKICEFACRFGDPEAILLFSTLIPSWTQVMAEVRDGTLVNGQLDACPVASVAMCLAPPGYPSRESPGHPFVIPDHVLHAPGVVFIPGSCERTSDGYRASGGRVGALHADADTIEEARARITALLPINNLYHRNDVALPEDIASKVAIAEQWHTNA